MTKSQLEREITQRRFYFGLTTEDDPQINETPEEIKKRRQIIIDKNKKAGKKWY